LEKVSSAKHPPFMLYMLVKKDINLTTIILVTDFTLSEKKNECLQDVRMLGKLPCFAAGWHGEL
jgi:hypothetical protein